MKDWLISKLRLPNLNGIHIEYNSEVDADLIKFLCDCTPLHLPLFAISFFRYHPNWIKSKLFIEAFSKVAARTSKEILFFGVNYSSKDLQLIVKAACNIERIVFSFCRICCYSDFNFGSDLIYKTKFLSFQTWKTFSFYRYPSKAWINDYSCFLLIVDAIRSSGLRTSLEKLNIYKSSAEFKTHMQEVLNEKGMSHISVIDENINWLWS